MSHVSTKEMTNYKSESSKFFKGHDGGCVSTLMKACSYIDVGMFLHWCWACSYIDVGTHPQWCKLVYTLMEEYIRTLMLACTYIDWTVRGVVGRFQRYCLLLLHLGNSTFIYLYQGVREKLALMPHKDSQKMSSLRH